MKKLLLLLLSAGLLGYGFYRQWVSFDRMGARRFQVLSRPAKEVLVGVCWPFSVRQDGMADGLQLALSEINGGRMTGDLPIRLIIRDDEFGWDKGKRIAAEFSNTPAMSAVIGYYDSSIAIKASAMYETSRLLHLIIGANNTAMTDRGFKYIVRTILSSDSIAASLARISVARGYRKYALLWEDAAYGEDLAYQYHISMDSLNTELLCQRSFRRDGDDFRLMVNQLKEIQPDVIFFAGLEPWAGDFLRAARVVGITTPIIGAFTITPEMRRRAGPALEGAMYFDIYDVNSPSPQNREFVRRFRARFRRDPDAWAAQAYDALYLLAKAVRATRSVNPLDLCYAIRYMAPWEGANGLYRFDGRGELADKSIYLNATQNGKPVTIQESRPQTVQAIQ